jgi:hypothetical protein
VPATIATLFILSEFDFKSTSVEHVITVALGAILMVTAFLLIVGRKLRDRHAHRVSRLDPRKAAVITVLLGVVMGVLVTATSVGAGAMGVHAGTDHGKTRDHETGMIPWTILIALALAFIAAYAARYFVHFDEATFGPYWPRRPAILLHIGAGIVALLTAPFQFWSGYRQMPMVVHRWIGRVFVGGATVGSAAALYLAVTTTFGWAFGFATMMMNLAWLSTTAMAYFMPSVVA